MVMATQDDSILGLRTQIFENWRYVHPEHAKVVILTIHHPIDVEVLEADDFVYGAVIAEDRNQGNRIFLRALSQYNIETALRDLLSLTNDLVKEVIKDISIKGLEVKPVNQDFASAGLKRVEPELVVNRELGRGVVDARRWVPKSLQKTETPGRRWHPVSKE